MRTSSNRRGSMASLAMVSLASLSLIVPEVARSGSPQYVMGNFNQSTALLTPGSSSEPSISVGPRHVFAQLHGSLTAFTKDGQFAPPFTQNGEPMFTTSIQQFYGLIDDWCHPTFTIDGADTHCEPQDCPV